MAATVTGVPKWLLDCKDVVAKSKAWDQFVEELQTAIQQQLAESHVGSFADLTDSERTLFVERAARALQEGRRYVSLFGNVSEHLDRHMNNEVIRQMMTMSSALTKTELVTETALDGLITLLQKWPDMKWKLHVCFNQPLPSRLRKVAWRLFLENAKARNDYKKLLSTNPRKAISKLDLDISKECERILMTEPTLSELNGSVGAFYAMKATLSYSHSLLGDNSEPIPRSQFMLTIPTLYLISSALPRREPAPLQMVLDVVEQHLTIMASLPDVAKTTPPKTKKTQSQDPMDGFAERVAKHLEDIDGGTAEKLTALFAPAKEKIVETDAGRRMLLADAVKAVITPVIQNLFVGFLNLPAVMFVWDQYIISMDVPGFHNDLLAALSAVFIALNGNVIENCISAQEVEFVIKTESSNLTVRDIQYQLNKHFEGLYSQLNVDGDAAFPVLDPTQHQPAAWKHWHAEKLPQKSAVDLRRKAQEARDQERKRQMVERERLRALRQSEEDASRRREEEHAMEEQERTKQQYDTDKQWMEGLLQEERRLRLETERANAAEIDRLKEEIEDMRREKLQQKSPSASSRSAMSDTSIRLPNAPPASMATDPTLDGSRPSLAPSIPPPTPTVPREQAMVDLLKNVQEGLNNIARDP